MQVKHKMRNNQIMSFGTRVGSARRYGRAALILGRNLRNVPNSIILIVLLFIITILSCSSGSSTSALTYQSELDMQFTFNPTVAISVSGDLTIPDLAPGSSSDSNIITITAGSNDAHGYTLYGTVGSSSSNYTDLRITPSDSTNKFTNLSSNKASLANFSDNTWGYSYSTDSGSTWKSGNAGSTSSGYNGLPLYSSSNNASGVILASTNSASETSLRFKIGAKASSTQVSSTYTNTINFIGVGKVVTTSYTLTYNGNNADTGTVPTAQSGSTTDGVIALSETTPTREGYIFKGWCDTDNSSDPTTCTGNTYNPGRIYIIPAASQGGTVTINTYAIWENNAPVTYSVTFEGSLRCPNDSYTGSGTYSAGENVSFTYSAGAYAELYANDASVGTGYSITHDFIMPSQNVIFRVERANNEKCVEGGSSVEK